MNTQIKFIRNICLSSLLLIPAISSAESNFQTGTGALTATGRLDFSITVPKTLYVRIGTGANLANNATVDLINFTVPAANVGNGVPVAGVGGDIGAGTVTARVIGNNGAITFGSTTTGPLNNGAGDSISYTQIATAVAANTSATPLAAPALADAATTNITLTPNIGTKVTNLDARWTYTYLNSAVAAPGTYGGVNANAGRVTYTASMP
ncbi:MAG TPA: hypothetical protein PLW03_08755 [Methylotenera sp.]|nr:hypothetical protein [Methylotenera sp.]